MPLARPDLLSATRSLLRAAAVLDLCLLALLCLILAALLFGGAEKMSIASFASLPPDQRLFAMRVMVTGGALCCALLWPLLRLLLRIVESARAGDPFAPGNGACLRRIGGLFLAAHASINLAAAMALHGHPGLPVSFSALLTVLMVFVIARVFDAGSAMRAELQGTV